MTDPRSEVERRRDYILEAREQFRRYVEAHEFHASWCNGGYPGERCTCDLQQRIASITDPEGSEARFSEAEQGEMLERAWAEHDVTAPEGGDPLVGPAVCYACPMFEGAAHMPDAANHRPDPEGGDKE